MQEHMIPYNLHEHHLESVVEYCINYSDLVRPRFASRYRSSKKYLATVQLDSDQDEEPITG